MSTDNMMPRWDLTHIYDSIKSAKIDDDLKDFEIKISNFSKHYKGKVNSISATSFFKMVKEYEDICDISGKLGSFAFLAYATNITNDEYNSFYQGINEKITNLTNNLIFFTLEINEMDDERVEELLKDSNLSKYRPWFRDTRAFKEYQLSEKEEVILSEKYLTSSGAFSRLFDQTIASLRFDWKGEKIGCSSMLLHLSASDPKDRKKAATEISRVLGNSIKQFSFFMNTIVKDKELGDNRRGFKQPISSRNFSNYVEDDVVDTLIDTVKENYSSLSHRYYRLKAKMMGKKKIDWWDMKAPLDSAENENVPWQEAVNIVLDSYGEFSPKLRELGKEFFDNKLVDFPCTESNMGGAFAHPTVPSIPGYLMLNYQGKRRDVMTMAHELGHGVHHKCSEKQGILMCYTPITLAETASVFGEQLTFRSMLRKEKDEEKRKHMIASKVEDMLATVVRQTAFCDFERHVHDERRKSELSSDKINEIWMSTQKEALGDAVNLSDDYKYLWSYIPHFIHSPFYVYAYAFGDCLVNSLYSLYQSGKVSDFTDRYFTMLEAGGTMRHKELLGIFDLDAHKKSFWQGGMNMIIGLIDELEKKI